MTMRRMAAGLLVSGVAVISLVVGGAGPASAACVNVGNVSLGDASQVNDCPVSIGTP